MYRKIAFNMIVCLLMVLCPLAVNADSEKGEKTCQCPCPCPKDAINGASLDDSEENPEELTLNEKGEVYGPVNFTHKGHNEYVDKGCVSCHHTSAATGEIKSCADCHDKPVFQKAEQLNVLNLKAAFHKQCIVCHENNGSGPTGCTECHELKK